VLVLLVLLVLLVPPLLLALLRLVLVWSTSWAKLLLLWTTLSEVAKGALMDTGVLDTGEGIM
jgi:hypothetical protein